MTAGRNHPHGAPIAEVMTEALANLCVQGQRSALALLGILIGTASIIAMLNIGHIGQLETLKLFRAMGTDMLMINASPVGQAPAKLDPVMLEQLPRRDPDVLRALPMATGIALVAAERAQAQISIVAIPPGSASSLRLIAKEGRLLGPADDCAANVMIGPEAAIKLSAPAAPLVPGKRVGIDYYAFTVVGVLAPRDLEALTPLDYNNAVFMPLACARRVLRGSDPTTALITLRPGTNGDAAGKRIGALLANPESSLQIANAAAEIRALNAQKAVHSQLLTAIGAVSLLVGGIGVMNVMLMNMMERKREIGLRAAIGATPRDLYAMFLLEAATLALVGGIFGSMLGVGISFLFARYSGWSFDLALYVLPLGPGVAGMVGLIFGFYPAFAAARLNPVEALRAE